MTRLAVGSYPNECKLLEKWAAKNYFLEELVRREEIVRRNARNLINGHLRQTALWFWNDPIPISQIVTLDDWYRIQTQIAIVLNRTEKGKKK